MTIPIYAFQGDKYHLNILLGQNKTNLLISYFFLKKLKNIDEILGMVKKASNPNSIFMLDSGAFSAWNSGTMISLHDYIDFIKQYHQYFTHIVCLDVINDPIYSEVNHLIMLGELKDYNLEIIPVFHAGESFAVLDYMVEMGYKYIGISPNNNWREEEKRKWLTRVFQKYDFEKLGIKTHGFGYQSVSGLKHFPLSSGDAISWKIAAGMGEIICPNSHIAYSEKKKHVSTHVDKMKGGDLDFVLNICDVLGIEVNTLRNNYKHRCMFNIEAISELLARPKERISTLVDLLNENLLFDKEDVFITYKKVKDLRTYNGYPLSIIKPFGKAQKRNTESKINKQYYSEMDILF